MSLPDSTRRHRPVMVAQVVHHLEPRPGDVVVDATLGGGGHARAILPLIDPGGRLLGLDLDPVELPRTEAALRAEGIGPDRFIARSGNFSDLPAVLAREGISAANAVLVDLGVSTMQHDTAARGFSYKRPGPLDLRMNPQAGEPASSLVAQASEMQLIAWLRDHADEPHAEVIAGLLRRQPVPTTNLLERTVRQGLHAARPALTKAEVKMSVRRTFQALRIAVNDELTALDRLLQVLPECLAPGGRVVFLTFHSGEDRRVKRALRAGLRAGRYAEIAAAVVRSAKDETFANRRAAAAKLRWARTR